MVTVNVRYLGVIRSITRKKSEEFAAESFGELMDKIGQKYEIIRRDYFSERESDDSSLITTLNGRSVYAKDYGRKLKERDQVMVGTVISGG